MAKSDAYHKLIYELGDQARDRLAEMQPPLDSMNAVFDAEDLVMAKRGELEALEEQLNTSDSSYRTFQETQTLKRVELEAIVQKYRKAVDAIEGKVKDLRKKLAAARVENNLNRDGLKAAEVRQNDLEMSQPDPVRVEQGRNMIKRMRVAVLRKEREIGEFESTLAHALTPEPGQPGGAGIDAHRQLIEMDDASQTRKREAEEELARLDKAVAKKEAEVEDSEAELADALFQLGEECYARRLDDPVLNPLYPRIDKVK